MSGHSKWAQIKRQKGVADVKRGKLFSQLSKAITIAAKQGGDPDFNPTLRIAVEKAKKSNMPADNIEKAIKKGTGELAGASIEEVLYEAYGPGGIALIIEGATDNNNRTVSEIKHILSKNDGRLGEAGSVKWMFERFGYIEIEKENLNVGEDELETAIINSGAQDYKQVQSIMVVYTKPEDVYEVEKNLNQDNIETGESGFEWIAKNKMKIEDEKTKLKTEKLFEELDDHDDVSEIYSNIEE